MKNFTHLHVHTAYSLLDGAARIDNLLDTAKNFGMNSIAMTDHGVMYGTIEFYKAAIKRGIKPIIGCEVYLAPKSHTDKNSTERFHLVLLAENNIGYKNLIKLVSIASTSGFYYKPRIDLELLREYHEGIIALSACLYGEIPQAILKDDIPRAVELVGKYVEIFGKKNFFLEIQNHGLKDEEIVRDALIKISHDKGINLVATNDVHYVNRSDSYAHDVLLCIQTGKLLSDEHRLKFNSDDYYLKSPSEMYELFAEIPEACENTIKIAERCNVELKFGELHLPAYELPENFSNADNYLSELCRKKIYDRYKLPDKQIFDRMNYELGVIKNMKYAEYFLIVQDFINYAKGNNIPVGPGRGSATGSVVAYVLGITEIDPLKYNLLFERFLNPDRVSMPDIDIDFCYRRREEVIDYVKEKYGESHVAQIVTFGTMAAKAVIRDVARVMEISYSESSRLADMIPNELKITLDKSLESSSKLKSAYESNSVTKEILNLARQLEGLPRHASVHAAGIVISKDELTEYLPVQNLKGVSKTTTVTQFDKDGIEELGLLKMDFLGLRTLTIIYDTIENIRTNKGEYVDISEIPLADVKTAEMLSRGDTGAVFQMESPGMTRLVTELKPTCFEDLIPTIALFRPGPLGSGMVKDFVDGKHGLQRPTYLHPKLEPILRETFGVILYQEQVMQIVQALAGFSLGQADLLRRAMAKKKASIISAQKENFLNGCTSNGIDGALAEKIFTLLEYFADYGFNKSHSAAYALLAWQTAYLKAYYPVEFMAATLSSLMDSNKLSAYIELTKRMGIKISPPDINSSGVYFRAEGNQIYFALSAIKNVGETAIEEVVKVRKVKPFESLTDFCERIGVKHFNRGALENLIKCGAFDSIQENRKGLVDSLGNILEKLRNPGAKKEHLIYLFNNGSAENEAKYTEMLNKDTARDYSVSERLKFEKDILGYYVSGHPLDKYKEKISHLKNIDEIKNAETKVKTAVKICGLVTDYRKLRTKAGASMAFITIEDFNGIIRVVFFSKIFRAVENFLAEGKIVVIEGITDFSKGDVEIFADNVTPIENYSPNIYLTLTDEKNNAVTKQALKNIFLENQGDGEIYLRQNRKWTHITNQGKLSINEEVLSKLKNLLGAENVKLY